MGSPVRPRQRTRQDRTRDRTGDSNTKRELQRFAKDPFQSLAEYGSVHDSLKAQKNLSEELTRKIPPPSPRLLPHSPARSTPRQIAREPPENQTHSGLGQKQPRGGLEWCQGVGGEGAHNALTSHISCSISVKNFYKQKTLNFQRRSIIKLHVMPVMGKNHFCFKRLS